MVPRLPLFSQVSARVAECIVREGREMTRSREEIITALENPLDEELYEVVRIGQTIGYSLTEKGTELAREADLQVDVDAYGCAFPVLPGHGERHTPGD